MKIKSIGKNQTVLTLGNGDEIFFSYETPVAACIQTPEKLKYFKTSTHYSVTTTKHINKYLDGRPAAGVTQEFINDLLDS